MKSRSGRCRCRRRQTLGTAVSTVPQLSPHHSDPDWAECLEKSSASGKPSRHRKRRIGALISLSKDVGVLAPRTVAFSSLIPAQNRPDICRPAHHAQAAHVRHPPGLRRTLLLQRAVTRPMGGRPCQCLWLFELNTQWTCESGVDEEGRRGNGYLRSHLDQNVTRHFFSYQPTPPLGQEQR